MNVINATVCSNDTNIHTTVIIMDFYLNISGINIRYI